MNESPNLEKEHSLLEKKFSTAAILLNFTSTLTLLYTALSLRKRY